MNNLERAEKILGKHYVLNGVVPRIVMLDILVEQLDEAVAEAVEKAFGEANQFIRKDYHDQAVEKAVREALEERFGKEDYKDSFQFSITGMEIEKARREGFASAVDKAAEIAEHATAEHGCYLLDNCHERNLLSVEGWIAERIRSLKASSLRAEEKRACSKYQAEISKLKAELESVIKNQQWHTVNDTKVMAQICEDRDLWKMRSDDAEKEIVRITSRAAKYREALEKMVSPETDWENGEIGVGNTFRAIAQEALKEQA